VHRAYMSKIKSTGIALLIVLGFGFGFYQACLTKHKITSWNEYCEYLDGKDLYRKYRVAMLAFDYEAIRDDFVRKFHDSFVSSTREQFSLKQNYLLRELESQKMLGAWREELHLHAANNFVTSKPVGGALTFSEWIAEYTKFTDPAFLKEKGDLSSYDYCVFRSMNALFEDVTIHGESETATIPLQNTVSRQKK
jgi:hypothetical protein